ncbi:MAG TPA: patatin-like phospholipase family protein [Streptosporangiaceae bacterium]
MQPRRGLVLGSGGILGAAWMTGALAALQQRLPVPVGELDFIVGTSAGSVLVAALRRGFTVDQMAAHQRDGPRGALAALGSPDLGCGSRPPRPRFRLGSPRLLLTGMRAPRQVHPWVLASACLPEGRAEHHELRAMLLGLDAQAEGWPACGETWIMAVDFGTGQRVAFGRRGAPPASLPEAVVASCSVPGWFRPAVIGGHRYVDGGARSIASADQLAGVGLDEVYVLAADASLVMDRPRRPLEWAERRLRALLTSALLRELGTLRSSGTRVIVLTPGPEDLAAMGSNLMDPSRRRDVFEVSLSTSARSLADVPATLAGR